MQLIREVADKKNQSGQNHLRLPICFDSLCLIELNVSLNAIIAVNHICHSVTMVYWMNVAYWIGWETRT